MKHRKSIGLTFAVLAITSAPMTSTAFAGLPEFQQAGKFVGTGLKAVLETEGAGPTRVECQTSEIEGEVLVAKVKIAKKINIRFQGCESGGIECKTAGAAAKEIKTEALEGEVGYIKPAVGGAKTIVFALEAEAVGGPIAKYTCANADEEKGCLAGALSNASELTKKFTLVFKQLAGVQEIIEYEPEKTVKKKCVLKVKIGAEEKTDALETTQKIITCPGMEVKS
ncbi:MAG TPA: hypothetical protein VNY31_01080 [Solirubrobacteraceae bacterium]|jgi:hypothetical protein|nr:hypothetical protein [Solirubrobacteraceae bacterium]